MANKKNIPPMPFDAAAWLSNNAAIRLSFACKGLWLDMLCCMWVSIERGVMLKPIGGAYTIDELQSLYGNGTRELIEALINAELLSVRHDGALYNADMVKMESIRVKRSEAGRKGGITMKERILTTKTVEVPPLQPPTSSMAEKPQEAQTELFPDDVPSSPPPLTDEQQRKLERAKKYKYAEYVTLTRDEYAKLCAEYSEESAKEMIDILNNYKGSKGKKYKSDYLAIRGWVKDKYYEKQNRYGQQIGATAATDTGQESGKRTFRETL